MTTHSISPSARPVGRRRRLLADCGELVDGAQFSTHPTCEKCQRINAEDDAETLRVMQLYSTAPPNPVRSTLGTPTAAYVRRGEERTR